MFCKLIFHFYFCTAVPFLLTAQMVFNEENKETPIKLNKTLQPPEGDFALQFLRSYNPAGGYSFMTSTIPNHSFVYENMCTWSWWFLREKGGLHKYSLFSQVHEEYPRPIEELAIRFNERSPSRGYFSKIHYSNLAVSPNEKYVLLRKSLELHEISEAKTGFTLKEKLPAGEIILGFDSQSNIYCGRLTSPSEFVVRDPETMQIVKSFQRAISGDTIKRDTAEQDLFYAACPLPMESPDRKYVVFQFYQHRPPGVTAKMHENDPRLLKEWVEMEKNDSRESAIGEVHVYAQESGLLVYESPLGIGVQNSWAHALPQISADGQKIAYPDYVAKGVWVYDFETRKSTSLLVPPPPPLDNPGNHPAKEVKSVNDAEMWEWRRTNLKSFTFTPENEILVCLYLPNNMGYPNYPWIYRFDLETGESQPMTDFVSEKEFLPKGDTSEYDKL